VKLNLAVYAHSLLFGSSKVLTTKVLYKLHGMDVTIAMGDECLALRRNRVVPVVTDSSVVGCYV
jgi:hypothetical protein